MPAASRPQHRAGFAQALAGNPSGRVLDQRIQVAALRADGSEFPCEIAVMAIEDPSGEPMFTAYLRDISGTETLRAERDDARYAADHDELTTRSAPPASR